MTQRDPECIFCKIIAGEIPSTMIYEDELVVAFRDINPVAPVHVLIVPRKHILDNNDYEDADAAVAGQMFSAVRQIAAAEGIAASGYRLILNTGPDGHQEINHLHLHLIGGHSMRHAMG